MSSEVILAGVGAGVRVFSSPAVAGSWKELKKQAANRNYWASIIIKQIQQLTAGRLGNDYAYVKNVPGNQNKKEFCLILPGCKAIAEARSDGTYFISDMVLDDTFFQHDDSPKKMGLFYSKGVAVNNKKEWTHTALRGTIKDNANLAALQVVMPVGISDAYEDIDQAANYVEEHISASPFNPAGVGDVKNGFNLFYTHGKSKFGGLLSMKEALGAASHKSGNVPALLLAEAMNKASNTPVVWVSQRGGSAVLAQALGIIKARGVTLPKHKVYLSNPTTSQTDIYRLAQGVGIKVDDKFANNNFLSVDELMGGLAIGSGSLSLIHERQKADRAYGWRKAAKDLLTANGNYKSAAATASSLGGFAAVGGLFGAGFTVASALAAGPAAAIAGAVGGAAALAAANIPGLKDYSSPGKMMLKKMGF